MKRMTVFALVCVFLIALPATGKRRSKGKGAAKFDYYLLSLSWAPNYCAGHPTDKSRECKVGAHAAFVLHGLWPQADSGPPPMACKPASPVSRSVATHMLQYMPSRSLIQHEWSKHGTCSGLSSADYFKNVEEAFTAVNIPDQYQKLDQPQEFEVKKVEQNFAQSNNAPPEAFRISCHAGELVSVEACLTKDLKYQPCSETVRECSSDQVLMRPVK